MTHSAIFIIISHHLPVATTLHPRLHHLIVLSMILVPNTDHAIEITYMLTTYIFQ
jgi:hypothetical protein